MSTKVYDIEFIGATQTLVGVDYTVFTRAEIGGYILLAAGAALPVTGIGGFAPGATFIYSGAGLGACLNFTNVGSTISCLFVPSGPQAGWGFYRVGEGIASAGGDAVETISVPDAMTTDIAIADHQASNDTDTILSTLLTRKTITITASADPSTVHAYNYAVIRQGCLPEYDIVFAGTHVTLGGAAAEAITLTGALATDIAFVTYGATNDTDTLVKNVMTANTLTVTMSANPVTNHSLHYMVLRRRGIAKPSHYIAYAGLDTTAGPAANVTTITGALVTDIPIVGYSIAGGTLTILKAVMTANTLTVTHSGDPTTANQIWYLILRAY